MKKILLSIGSVVSLLAPITGVVSCNNEKPKHAVPATTLIIPKKVQNDLSLISSKLTTSILRAQLNKYLIKEKDFINKLNEKAKYKITIDKSELSHVSYENGKVSYKITFNTTKQNIKYKRIEVADGSEIKFQNTQGTNQLGIKVKTKQINNRIKDSKSRNVEDVISIRRLLGKWDDKIAGISDIKESSLVKNIKLFHTNDTHGRMERDDGKYNKYIGMNQIAGYVTNTKHDLFLSGGDFMQGTGVSNYDSGNRAMQIASIMGYDAIAAGNHEFDFGFKTLLKRAETAPIYSTNTLYNGKNGTTDGNEVLPGVRTKIIKGDLPVGIITLTTPDVSTIVSTKDIVSIKMESIYKAAKREVKRLEDAGVKLIIAVGHMGNKAASTETSKELAKNVKGLDLIIDGHSHKLYKVGDKVINHQETTYIAQTGSYTRNLGEINFDFDRSTGRITHFSNKYIDFNQMEKIAKPKINSIDKIIQQAKAEYKIYGSKPAFKSESDLFDSLILKKNEDGKVNKEKKPTRTIRTFESSAGNFFADALRWSGKNAKPNYDVKHIIGLAGGGSIRASIAKGERKVGDIKDMAPYGNSIKGAEVTGKQLWAILNHSAKQWEAGGFMQVSKNMEITYNVFKNYKEKEKESTSKNEVTMIKIGGVKVLNDDTQKYFMLTNDYTFGGGDGYKDTMTSLKSIYDGPVILEQLIEFGKILKNEKGFFSWKDYSTSRITPAKATRIKIIGGDDKAKKFIEQYNNIVT